MYIATRRRTIREVLIPWWRPGYPPRNIYIEATDEVHARERMKAQFGRAPVAVRPAFEPDIERTLESGGSRPIRAPRPAESVMVAAVVALSFVSGSNITAAAVNGTLGDWALGVGSALLALLVGAIWVSR